MKNAEIYIIRHGETDMNRAQCLQGHIDCELNSTGIAEAEAAASRLKTAGISFTRVYSSPLKRARQTAEILAGGAEVISEPLISEMHFGSYEGRPYSDIDEAMWAFIHSPETVSPPEGVESIKSLCSRTGEFLHCLLTEDIGGNILLVTHGIALRSILWNLSPIERRSSVWSLGIENCVIYRLSVYDGKPGEIRRAYELSELSDTDTSGKF